MVDNFILRNRFLIYIFLLFIMLAGAALSDRHLMMNYFMVDSQVTESPDLLVLLEGGDWLYSPTRERINKLIEIYKRKPNKILICSYPRYKDELVKVLILNGVLPLDIVKSKYVYDGRGGTYNNVSEIIDVLKNNKEYKVINIVTSPYHEKRVQIIVSKLLYKSGINRRVKIYFAHIKHSDIYYTNNERYIDMIGHEILGIAWFYMQMLQVKYENLNDLLVTARLNN